MQDFPRENRAARKTYTATIEAPVMTVRSYNSGSSEQVSGNGISGTGHVVRGLKFKLRTETAGDWVLQLCAEASVDAGAALWLGIELDDEHVSPDWQAFISGTVGVWGGHCVTWIAPNVPAGQHQIVTRGQSVSDRQFVAEYRNRTLTIWHPR